MNIGIITQPLRYNYGGILQNFALQIVLKRLGHQVTTLDGEVKITNNFKRRIINIVKSFLLFFRDKRGRILGIIPYRTTHELLSINTNKFIRQYINSKKISSFREVDYDVLIVGSDQVWRPSYSNLDEAYLDFVKNNKNIVKIAYSASFGSDIWEYSNEETIKYSQLIKLFDAVSVREESGIHLCRKYFNVDAIHVLDPTMLLNKEDYIKELNIENVEQSQGTLFYYFLDNDISKMDILKYVENELKIIPFTVNSKIESNNASIHEQIQPPVENWLRAFYDAEFIITDSFHGSVFSMLFNKPFIVIANKKRGLARFKLLDIFHQEHRLIYSDNLSKIDIDTSLPNINLDEMRKKSYSYLSENIKLNHAK